MTMSGMNKIGSDIQQISFEAGDCLEIMKKMKSESVDLIYLDPPYFTNKVHRLYDRTRTTEFKFDDLWENWNEYAEFLKPRLILMKKLLRSTGSIFFHCDKTASHVVRTILDAVFGEDNFQSEIIWYYKRWSNAKAGFLPAHQTIFFYSKTKNFKFNVIYGDYSHTTNVDQILQKRTKDAHGKSVYSRDETGEHVPSDVKSGVPLSDVWEMPYLNPKAKERAGYPTQKPLHLLERILQVATDSGDFVLDPFCGSGTTVVAAKILNRHAMGIDISNEAIQVSRERIESQIRSISNLLIHGRESYNEADLGAIAILTGLEIVPIHRNRGIDALAKNLFLNRPVPIRVQRSNESLQEACFALMKAAQKKSALRALLIQTSSENYILEVEFPSWIKIIPSTAYSIKLALAE